MNRPRVRYLSRCLELDNANADPEFSVNGTGIPDVDFDVGESYAGLLPISKNEKEERELYFWFFPSENADADDEILIWLNGGVSLALHSFYIYLLSSYRDTSILHLTNVYIAWMLFVGRSAPRERTVPLAIWHLQACPESIHLGQFDKCRLGRAACWNRLFSRETFGHQ